MTVATSVLFLKRAARQPIQRAAIASTSSPSTSMLPASIAQLDCAIAITVMREANVGAVFAHRFANHFRDTRYRIPC